MMTFTSVFPDDVEFVELSYGDAPMAFVAVVSKGVQETRRIEAAGAGATVFAALQACLGELTERRVAMRTTMRQSWLTVSLADLPAIEANTVWGFSAEQLRQLAQVGDEVTPSGWQAAGDVLAGAGAWCPARRAGGAAPSHRVPRLVACLSVEGTPNSSNGLAAATSRQKAEEAALLELVERDAVAIWWHNRARRPGLPLELLAQAGNSALHAWLLARERQTWLLDLTHDARTPVVAALSASADGDRIAYGFAARLTHAEAAMSAVREMLQTELSLVMARARADQCGGPEGPAGRLLVWSDGASIADRPHLVAAAEASAVPAAPIEEALPARLTRAGQGPVLFVDLDEPGDSFPVVRAIVPGLCYWRVRQGFARLSTVPASLGWAVDSERRWAEPILI